ncbi:hypothetical protein BGZ49_006430, partial [Haplosporangium sp. Z 27]
MNAFPANQGEFLISLPDDSYSIGLKDDTLNCGTYVALKTDVPIDGLIWMYYNGAIIHKKTELALTPQGDPCGDFMLAPFMDHSFQKFG